VQIAKLLVVISESDQFSVLFDDRSLEFNLLIFNSCVVATHRFSGISINVHSAVKGLSKLLKLLLRLLVLFVCL
jgi:hypothetical protein